MAIKSTAERVKTPLSLLRRIVSTYYSTYIPFNIHSTLHYRSVKKIHVNSINKLDSV